MVVNYGDENIEFSRNVSLPNYKGKTQLCLAFGECTNEIEDKDKEIFNFIKEFFLKNKFEIKKAI